MSLYCVRCQSASGKIHDAYVRARTETRAINEALRTLPHFEGWRAVWVLAQ